MKRALSFLLAAVIAASGLAFSGVSASAAETEKPAAYLLGDVNLDGQVSVGDVTALQRSLAEISELSGLQTELAKVDGEELSVQTATLIQNHLAELETGCPISEPAGDENEGVVYSEKAMMYACVGGQTASQQDKVTLSTAYPEVAFVSDMEALQTFVMYAGYQLNDLVVSEGDGSRTFTLPNGASVVFDYARKMMAFSDYATFTAPNGSVPFNPYGNTFPAAMTLYQIEPSSRYFGSNPVIVTFDYTEVPMLQKDGSFLVPMQTFCDFFMTPLQYFVQYNGKSTFMMPLSVADAFPDFWKFYNDDTEKREQISGALAQVNYYELCNILEARYGLREAHNIDRFDAYFSRRGLRGEFLSGNVERIENANNMLGTLLFEDLHSGANSTSPFYDDAQGSLNKVLSPVFENRINANKAMAEKRRSALGENPAPYERRGDTVFITFDEFLFNGFNHFYQPGFEPSANPDDTIELFAYALRRLQNEDSDVKNVVVDIACNGGGAALSCGFVMEALIGKCIICLNNPNNAALSQYVTKFDLNLDGVIDENDISVKEMGKNVAAIISDNSFSCGNLLPCSLNALDSEVLLLGQQSGGGSCSVGYISNAIGSIMQISGEKMLVTMKNGYIHDIDNGITPHIPMSANRMFDREYIKNTVNDYFG